MKKILLLALLFVSSSTMASKLNILLGFNASFGGEAVATLPTSDGENDKLNAGDGFGLHTGLSWRFHQNIDARASIGYLSTSHKYKNGSMSFRRYPLDISSHYFWGSHGLGGGLAYHISPKVEVEVTNLLKIEANANDALGYFVEYLYAKSEGGFYGSLRYTMMSYRHPKATKAFDANSCSINAGWAF